MSNAAIKFNAPVSALSNNAAIAEGIGQLEGLEKDQLEELLRGAARELLQAEEQWQTCPHGGCETCWFLRQEAEEEYLAVATKAGEGPDPRDSEEALFLRERIALYRGRLEEAEARRRAAKTLAEASLASAQRCLALSYLQLHEVELEVARGDWQRWDRLPCLHQDVETAAAYARRTQESFVSY